MKKSRVKRFLTAIFFGLWVGGIAATEVQQIQETKEYFAWFVNEGMYSADVSDDDVRRIISIGIKSDNPEVVSQTVLALGIFSAAHELKGYPDYQLAEPVLDRSSLKVPGLKSFLINYWRTQTTSVADDSRYPSWEFVPRTLAFIFPGDAEVLDVIWEIAATKRDRTYDLQLMNLGKFNTPEVTRHRIESLFIEYSSIGDEHLKLAAWGLAEHQTPEGLTALVQRLSDSPHEELHFVVDAIGEYGSEALPYLDQLQSFQSNYQNLGDNDPLEEQLGQLIIKLETLDSAESF